MVRASVLASSEQRFFLFGEKRVVWVSCLPLFSIYRKEFSCTYVRTYYVHRRDTDKTYASCWLARVAVGLLMLQCLRRTAITQITSTARASNLGIYTKIEVGGDQGNRTRNRQVFS